MVDDVTTNDNHQGKSDQTWLVDDNATHLQVFGRENGDDKKNKRGRDSEGEGPVLAGQARFLAHRARKVPAPQDRPAFSCVHSKGQGRVSSPSGVW